MWTPKGFSHQEVDNSFLFNSQQYLLLVLAVAASWVILEGVLKILLKLRMPRKGKIFSGLAENLTKIKNFLLLILVPAILHHSYLNIMSYSILQSDNTAARDHFQVNRPLKLLRPI